jgi:hypothetical protein
VTVAHCFTGAIDVTALADNTTQTLYQNESRAASSAGGETKQPTSPDVAQKFESATQAPAPGAAAKEEVKKAEGTPAGPAAPVSPAATGGETGAVADTTAANKAADTTSQQTVVVITTAASAREAKGYFVGMVTDKYTPGFEYLDNIYVSKTRQDFNSTKIRADGLYNSEGFIDGNPDAGFANSNPTLKQVAINTALVSADNLNLAVTKGTIGSNSYMEWGYWYVVDTFIVNSIVHDLWHRGFWIAGFPTPDAAVAGISGTYSGTAVGTYYYPQGPTPQGIPMSGNFSCNISSNTISNFLVDVSGPGKTAIISGASGTFNGSSFAINPNSGAWILNGFTLVPGTHYMAASGSLYGPNGENIGGAWGMKKDSGNGAVGIFQGAKQ